MAFRRKRPSGSCTVIMPWASPSTWPIRMSFLPFWSLKVSKPLSDLLKASDTAKSLPLAFIRSAPGISHVLCSDCPLTTIDPGYRLTQDPLGLASASCTNTRSADNCSTCKNRGECCCAARAKAMPATTIEIVATVIDPVASVLS